MAVWLILLTKLNSAGLNQSDIRQSGGGQQLQCIDQLLTIHLRCDHTHTDVHLELQSLKVAIPFEGSAVAAANHDLVNRFSGFHPQTAKSQSISRNQVQEHSFLRQCNNFHYFGGQEETLACAERSFLNATNKLKSS